MIFLRLKRLMHSSRAVPLYRARPFPPLSRLLFYQARGFCSSKHGSLYHSSVGEFFLRERNLTEKRSFSISDLCGHGSFVILAISFVCSELLHLRIAALFAGLSMATFNYFHPNGRPLWLPFRWNVLFLLINSGWIAYLLKLNYDANHLKKYENWLYEEVFALSGMKRVDFLKLVRGGELKIYNKGDHVTTQGTKSFWVQVLIEGSAAAKVDGKKVYVVTPGNFISELGIHSGIRNREQTSSASIVADDICVSIRWSRGALIDIMERNVDLGSCVQGAMTADLIKKMNRSAKEIIGSNKAENEDWYGNMDYRQILKGILRNEQISNRERSMLKRYRKMHFIDDRTHESIVNECGWSIGEFDFGKKYMNKLTKTAPKGAPAESDDIDMREIVQEVINNANRRSSREDNNSDFDESLSAGILDH